MANSKHAHLRYNILDYCFRKKALTFNDLLEYVNDRIVEYYPNEGISERTLRDDLKIFRDEKEGFGAPLPKKARVLKYSDPNFSIAQKPLLPYENELLKASQQLLMRFENHPKYNKLAEALIKFEDDELDDNLSKILFFDHNEEYKGIKYMKPFYLSIRKKQVLQIEYKGFKDYKKRVFEFHPQVLKQYNRRWFVFGYNNTNKIKEWSIPLDERIQNVEILKNAEYVNFLSNYETLFRHRIGITQPNDAKLEQVVLKFHNGREAYFKSKPFHPDFEEFFEPEKSDQVWFITIVNKELVQQILSYGMDVEVVKPLELKQELKKQARNMIKFYE